MKQIQLLPGKHQTVALLSTHDATGDRTAADSTPTLVLFVDDTGAGGFAALSALTITVTDVGATIDAGHAGSYAAQLDVDELLSSYDGAERYMVWGFWYWTMDGVDQSQPIEPFVLVPPLLGAIVLTGTNSASVFKIGATGDFAWASTIAALSTTSGPVDALATFITGSLAGQCRRVTAFNASTGYLTTDAFTGTPADNDKLMLSNF